ncbi:hypothetical protein PQQ87_08770 [Paraburkholderia nemoris]|uniref:hypothetical protein n=1 Tax=Paraburkholderia nemoris TaxID=2793076 RepID=UPI0038BB7C29
MRKWFKTVVDDRLLILLIPSVLMLATDMSILLTLGYALAICVALVGVAHWMRLILFPHFDSEGLFAVIEQSPIAAAITIASMALTTMFFVGALIAWMIH